MAPYYALVVRRSDGKLQAKAHGSSELNEPTKEQLNQAPNSQGICDFYRLCKADDSKVLDWRRKLGGMLMKEMPAGAKEPKDRNYILTDLPENYRLYEHVKYKSSGESGQPSKPSKNHAAGSNDRQDAYLYGYPSGRKKRFRSPNEFFPHLLWLVTDESGDPNNCSCKFCTPEEMETDKEKEKEKEKQPRNTAAVETTETKSKAPALSRPSDVLKQPPKERKPSTQAQPQPAVTQLSRPITTQAQTAPRPPGRPQLEPTMLPRARSMEQKLDIQPGKHIYRPGEVVWFKKGAAWGLGVIAHRSSDYRQTAPYRVQPLSHPFHQPDTLDLSSDQLRPWLAWSPPPTTCAGLRPESHNLFQQPTFDTVDWNSYVRGMYGPGDGEVDGSILAARQAETTYTPFDVISTNPIPNTPQPQGQETHFNGIYIGAEKIWVGDPLRLRYQVMTDIIVLHDIIEQPILNPSTYPNNSQTRIILVGDTFTLAVAQLEPHSIPQSDLHLPSRVRSELEIKNKLTTSKPTPQHQFTSFWRITAKNVRLGIEEIKGRWYESSLLLAVLDYQAFAQRHTNGDIRDAGGYMNGQGDCNKPDPRAQNTVMDSRTGQPKHRPADQRKATREAAFGQAVPANFRISKGLDENREGPRPSSSYGQQGLEGGASGSSTRPGSVISGHQSTPATSPGTMDLPRFGQGYGSQEEKGDMIMFQEGTEGLGDVQ